MVKPSKFLNVRISESLDEKLEKLAQSADLSKSEMIRQMISMYLNMNIMQSASQIKAELILKYRKPNMTINKVLVKNLFALIRTEEEIQKLAEKDYELGQLHRESIKGVSANSGLDILNPIAPLEKYIKTRINLTHGPMGLNWLDKVQVTIRGKSYYLTGEHRQGLNFSKYMKYKYILLMGFYSYKLAEERYENYTDEVTQTKYWKFRFKFRP